MKLLVCGGRDFRGRVILSLTLDAAARYGGFTSLICGYNPDDRKYQGADQLAYEWAMEEGFPVRVFPADWKRFGWSAGPRRNQQMADEMPDACAAFPRANGTWGKGTLNMIGKCVAKAIPVHQITDMHPDDPPLTNQPEAEGSGDAAQVEGDRSREEHPTPKGETK